MSQAPEPSRHQPDYTQAYRSHPRHFAGSELVYPVLSRRSGGISVGINLSPAKSCTFNCLYCQVARADGAAGSVRRLSMTTLAAELTETLETVVSGTIYEHSPFSQVPVELRRLNDIALSGDGEPTAADEFVEVCRLCAQTKTRLSLAGVKIVLITNSSLLDQQRVKAGLEILDKHDGEVWAKLDAGTEEYFKLVNQTDIPFRRIIDNLIETARVRPIVIQSLFFRIDGVAISADELSAYADRLNEVIASGGKISAVQLYTIARKPRDKRVRGLSSRELDRIAEQLSGRVDLPLEKYYGPAGSTSHFRRCRNP